MFDHVPPRSFQILYVAASEDALRSLLPDSRQALEAKLVTFGTHALALQEAQPGWLRAAVAQRPSLELLFEGLRVVYSVDVEARTIRVDLIEPMMGSSHLGR